MAPKKSGAGIEVFMAQEIMCRHGGIYGSIEKYILCRHGGIYGNIEKYILCRHGGIYGNIKTVSYTHLTLPTTCGV